MSHRVTIRFAPGSNVHYIRNLGEALFRDLPEIDGVISIDQVDVAVDRLEVTGIHSRKLKRVLAYIEKLLAEHNLSAEMNATHWLL